MPMIQQWVIGIKTLAAVASQFPQMAYAGMATGLASRLNGSTSAVLSQALPQTLLPSRRQSAATSSWLSLADPHSWPSTTTGNPNNNQHQEWTQQQMTINSYGRGNSNIGGSGVVAAASLHLHLFLALFCWQALMPPSGGCSFK